MATKLESEPELKTIVESYLPQQFLYELGVYLQTCAHIELAACATVCASEGLSIRSDEWNQRFFALRKLPMKELIKQLRVIEKRLPDKLRPDFHDFFNWIDKYSLNRHIASHGAFMDAGEGLLRVQYVHQVVDHGTKKYTEEMTQIDRSLVISSIKDADSILRILSGLSEEIAQGRVQLAPAG